MKWWANAVDSLEEGLAKAYFNERLSEAISKLSQSYTEIPETSIHKLAIQGSASANSDADLENEPIIRYDLCIQRQVQYKMKANMGHSLMMQIYLSQCRQGL